MSRGKHTETKEGGEDVTAFSKGVPEAAGKPSEHPVEYFSPTSTLSSSGSGEHATRGNPDPFSPAEPPMPTPLSEGQTITCSVVGMDIQGTFENTVESPTAGQDEIDASPAVTASAPLSLRCRMCSAPPAVFTRPTVTTCGHLFCSG